MAGRRVVDLALGTIDQFLVALNCLSCESNHLCSEWLNKLSAVDQAACNQILEGFVTAKSRITFRVRLAFSYWKQVPWKILKVMEPWKKSWNNEDNVQRSY